MAFFHRNRMCLVTQSCPTFGDPMDCQPTCPWGFFKLESLRLVSISLLESSQPGLPHHEQILYLLSHQESPTNRINYPEICMDSQNLCGFSQVAKAVFRKDKMLQALHSMISIIWCRCSNRKQYWQKIVK